MHWKGHTEFMFVSPSNSQRTPFDKNRIFEYLYACRQKNEYPFISNFIIFDFETLKNPANKKISSKMQSEATLHLISVG
jgi:rRNA-processing protein FCF1